MRARVTGAPSGSFVGINDLDYALRVSVTKAGSLGDPGQLFVVELDLCQGGDTPGTDDFGCTVEDCGSSFGPVAGCQCEIAQP